VNKFKKILVEHLVDPVLRLKETYPEYSFTEKGYETLVDSAIGEIADAIIDLKVKLPKGTTSKDITAYNETVEFVAESIKGE